MEVITLKEALTELESLQPCTITFIKCDRVRKIGGQVRTYQNVTFTGSNHKAATRNVILPNGKKKSFHIRLLLIFNNKKVIY